MFEIELSYPPGLKISIGLFKKLDGTQISGFIDALNKAEFPLKSLKRNDLYELLIGKYPLSESDIDGFFSAFTVLLSEYDKDSFDNVINFIKTQISDETIKTNFGSFLTSLNYLNPFFEKRRVNSYGMRANNYFTYIEYACDLRGRFKEDFNYKKIAIEKYDPDIIDLLPLISLQLKISDGQNETLISFQLEEDDLDQIISNLLAAQKEIIKLKEFIKKD